MMMIVDTVKSEKKFADIADEMERLGKEELGVEIRCQREEIFHQMHRI